MPEDPHRRPESEYEDYQRTSGQYDRTRRPLGVEVILAHLEGSPYPLHLQTVLDAGCGTGNFLMAIRERVGTALGLELNAGMLAMARQKARGAANVEVLRGSIIRPPLGDETLHAVMCNQVIHHLDAGDTSAPFPQLRAMLASMYRALKPGGAIIFNTSSHAQLRDGIWWAELIPEAVELSVARFPTIETLQTLLSEAGFRAVDVTVPLEPVLQSEGYLNPEGPLEQTFRDGDSTWSLATESELARALDRVGRMNQDGTIHEYLEQREALRELVGQTTFVHARKPSRSRES